MNSAKILNLPLDLSEQHKQEFIDNYNKLTHSSGKLFLVAGDQRVEHLVTSFKGEKIDKEDVNPEHYFKICSQAKIGAFATQIGFINRYGMDYKNIPYIVKLNSISKLSKKGYGYSFSQKWINVKDVYNLKEKTKLNILGVGYTVYVGIKDESKMFKEASEVIKTAHYLGLPVVLWVYPKGKAVKNETDPNIIATCTSIASALGADFVKVNAPDDNNKLENLKTAVASAGRTKVVTAGGEAIDPEEYIELIKQETESAGTSGVAVGRNIHQKSVEDAIKLCNEIYKVVIEQGKETKSIL